MMNLTKNCFTNDLLDRTFLESVVSSMPLIFYIAYDFDYGAIVRELLTLPRRRREGGGLIFRPF